MSRNGVRINDGLMRQMADWDLPATYDGLRRQQFRQRLLNTHHEFHSQSTREQIFTQICERENLPPLQVDPRLAISTETLQKFWQREVSFQFENLPAAAALALALHGSEYVLEYRLGCLWLTTPDLARTWQDKTEILQWFHALPLAERMSLNEEITAVPGEFVGLTPLLVVPKDWRPLELSLSRHPQSLHLPVYQLLAIGCELYGLRLDPEHKAIVPQARFWK
ncbi:hypothetical protein [Anatilimnocola floriformis]|uniref:hypothetical protein n=1 Tax=Anatilimnocola floriformis TaxID=2948575 RepID=UPI0020C2CDA0|nr:hypothetical protein [Anatilimnocola floriformis]